MAQGATAGGRKQQATMERHGPRRIHAPTWNLDHAEKKKAIQTLLKKEQLQQLNLRTLIQSHGRCAKRAWTWCE